MSTIYSFWISGSLQPINFLTICSFLAHRHRFIIYAYNVHELAAQISDNQASGFKIDSYSALDGRFEIRDAREILPEYEIFYYKKMLGGNPNFKFGGIAERLKAEMLYQLGGWHVDLDVTCLHSFESIVSHLPLEAWKIEEYGEPNELGMPSQSLHTPSYILRPHNTHGVVGNIIKAPKHSELARRYVEHTKTIDENNQHWEKSFLGLNQIVKDLQLEKYILPKEVLGDDGDWCWKAYLNSTDDKIAAQASNGLKGKIPPPQMHAIHWCNAMQLGYQKGSYYETLLKKYNL